MTVLTSHPIVSYGTYMGCAAKGTPTPYLFENDIWKYSGSSQGGTIRNLNVSSSWSHLFLSQPVG